MNKVTIIVETDEPPQMLKTVREGAEPVADLLASGIYRVAGQIRNNGLDYIAEAVERAAPLWRLR